MAVPVPTCKIGKSEVYIDDFLPVALDKGDNSYRVSAAVPLAIHSVGRQISPNEPLPRDDLISYTKMLAEAAMSETKTALGWLLNTRTLQVSLPDSKFIGWTHSINQTLGLTFIDSRALETLVGRLNHAASILHAMRQFLNRIRHLQFLAALHRKPINPLMVHFGAKNPIIGVFIMGCSFFYLIFSFHYGVQ